MNREELKNYLPHREPMLLVDEAEVDENGTAHGKYHVRGDEFFLDGHFPGNPVVPGVILCEMIAQNCCVLLSDDEAVKKATPYYTSLDNVRFKGMVKPGDTIELECRIVKSKAVFRFAEGTASVGGKVVAKADFSFALIG